MLWAVRPRWRAAISLAPGSRSPAEAAAVAAGSSMPVRQRRLCSSLPTAAPPRQGSGGPGALEFVCAAPAGMLGASPGFGLASWLDSAAGAALTVGLPRQSASEPPSS